MFSRILTGPSLQVLFPEGKEYIKPDSALPLQSLPGSRFRVYCHKRFSPPCSVKFPIRVFFRTPLKDDIFLTPILRSAIFTGKISGNLAYACDLNRSGPDRCRNLHAKKKDQPSSLSGYTRSYRIWPYGQTI
jgi:hypothetical protein